MNMQEWIETLSEEQKDWFNSLSPEKQSWFYSLATLTEIADLVKTLELSPQNESRFWEKLLALLKSENFPINDDELEEGSLFNFITTNEDLTDTEQGSALYNKIKDLIFQGANDNYWNDSLTKLIEFVIDKFIKMDDNTVILPIGDTATQHAERDITVGVLQQGDAGNNFPLNLRGAEETKWVIPWWNIDNKDYDEVRKHDEVLAILQNDKKMQYTRAPYADSKTIDEASKWIRLLMPQYGRRVEIEDLDRNFWVIAQVIAAISHYLFDEDAPLPKALEGLLREVTELWENILYLWLGIAAISQDKSDKVRIIVMPLPPRKNDHGRKYDKIGEADNICSYTETDNGYIDITYPTDREYFDKEVISRLSYLTEKYEENLFIIPIIRLNNYKHNYYSIEYYPGYYTYHRGLKKWDSVEFKEFYNQEYLPLCISPRYELKDQSGELLVNRYSNRIYGVRQMQGQIAYVYPFSKVGEIEDTQRTYLYGALRTIVTKLGRVEVQGDKFKLIPTYTHEPFFNFAVYDAGGDREETINNHAARYLGGYFGAAETVEEKVIIKFIFNRNNEDYGIEETGDTLQYSNYDEDNPICYLGEVASWRDHTIAVTTTDNLFTNGAYLLKVGNFLPTIAGTKDNCSMARVSVDSNTSNYTSMAGNVTTEVSLNTRNVNYFSFDWNSYNPAKDGSSTDVCNRGLGDICFDSSSPLTARSLSYFNADQLKYDGLKAVIKYLEAYPEKRKNPCYIATTVGLTPWQNENHTVYWDVSIVGHIYMYIPDITQIIPNYSPTDTHIDASDYIQKYTNAGALSLNNPSVSGETTVGNVMSGGQTVGKIIACQKIDRFEGYFDSFNMAANIYDRSPGGWRQFFINGDDELNKCVIKKIDGGASEGGKDVYLATFSDDGSFSGTVNYYDARWNQKNNAGAALPNEKAQIATAKISITPDHGYRQEERGKIVAASTTAFDDRTTNSAIDSQYTGLQRKLIWSEQAQGYYEQSLTAMGNINDGDTAAKFYGNTGLYNDGVSSLAKYKNP